MDGNRQDTAPVVKVPTGAQRTELTGLDQRIAALNRVMTAPNESADAARHMTRN